MNLLINNEESIIEVSFHPARKQFENFIVTL